jgi:hypothetical protein
MITQMPQYVYVSICSPCSECYNNSDIFCFLTTPNSVTELSAMDSKMTWSKCSFTEKSPIFAQITFKQQQVQSSWGSHISGHGQLNFLGYNAV